MSLGSLYQNRVSRYGQEKSKAVTSADAISGRYDIPEEVDRLYAIADGNYDVWLPDVNAACGRFCTVIVSSVVGANAITLKSNSANWTDIVFGSASEVLKALFYSDGVCWHHLVSLQQLNSMASEVSAVAATIYTNAFFYGFISLVGAGTISAISGGVNGALRVLRAANDGVVIANSATLVLNGGVNYSMLEGDILVLVKSGAAWYEVSRNVLP